jgi:hypothetical protein
MEMSKATALEEMSGQTLEDEFAALGASSEPGVDAEMEAMKARLGLAAPAARPMGELPAGAASTTPPTAASGAPTAEWSDNK